MGADKERIGYIDALKVFAAICVVMGHVADGYLSADMYPESNTFLYCIYNLIYSFHMPLFMMISGFVFCAAYVSDGVPNTKRIYKQVLNLIVIYFIFSILFGLFKIAVGRFTNKSVSILDVAMIWIKSISPFWYLYVLIILYCIFSLDRLYKIDAWILILIFTAFALVGQLIYCPYFEIERSLYYAIFFYIGLLYKREKIIISKTKTLALLAISVTLCILLWKGDKYLNNYVAFSIIIAFGISVTLWYLFENFNFLGANRVFQIIGRYSLEIYVIHCVFTAGLRVVFPRIGIESAFLSFFLNTVISTVIPISFSVICKNLNVHGLLFKPVTFITNLKKGD